MHESLTKKIQKEADDPKLECFTYKADYVECLHHKKEEAMNMRVAEQAKKIGWTKEGGIPTASKDEGTSAGGGGH